MNTSSGKVILVKFNNLINFWWVVCIFQKWSHFLRVFFCRHDIKRSLSRSITRHLVSRAKSQFSPTEKFARQKIENVRRTTTIKKDCAQFREHEAEQSSTHESNYNLQRWHFFFKELRIQSDSHRKPSVTYFSPRGFSLSHPFSHSLTNLNLRMLSHLDTMHTIRRIYRSIGPRRTCF